MKKTEKNEKNTQKKGENKSGTEQNVLWGFYLIFSKHQKKKKIKNQKSKKKKNEQHRYRL
jgi:hypothetical protein